MLSRDPLTRWRLPSSKGRKINDGRSYTFITSTGRYPLGETKWGVGYLCSEKRSDTKHQFLEGRGG